MRKLLVISLLLVSTITFGQKKIYSDLNIYGKTIAKDTLIIEKAIRFSNGSVQTKTINVSDSLKANISDSLLINTNSLVVRTTGQVGIGTTTPSEKLEVNGNVKITGNLKTNGAITIGDTTGFVLSNDSVSVTSKSNVILDTEAGAANDTLAVLTGIIGQIVYISTRNSGRDIAIMDADKFSLSVNRILNNSSDVLVLKATSATEWKEISFSNNGN